MTFQLFNPTASAEFSPCGTWRWTLTRRFAPGSTIAFVGLNPSRADQYRLDNTTTKCLSWAKRDGYGRYVMLNLFGLVSTDPKGLKTAKDPVGPDNDAWLRISIAMADRVVVAWGSHSHPMIQDRIKFVLDMIPDPYCCGLTMNGSPRHPLYVKNSTQLVPFRRQESIEKITQ